MRFQFVGGDLALDFVNTVGYRLNAAKRNDYFSSLDDVFRWAKEGKVITMPSTASRTSSKRFHDLLKLREDIFGIFSRISSGSRPTADELDWFASLAAECRSHKRLVWTGAGGQWNWIPRLSREEVVFWAVADAAVMLFTSADSQTIRQCAAPDCGWLFIDRSQGFRRRWCTMRDCGNRAKAQRHYRRHTRKQAAHRAARTGTNI